MKIAIVYVYAPGSAATPGATSWEFYSERFIESYHANPPGMEHETVIVLNGTHTNRRSHACLVRSQDAAFWNMTIRVTTSEHSSLQHGHFLAT